MSTTEPIRSIEDLRKLSDYFLSRKEYRNNAILIVGVHTALRIGDLLCLCWDDVYDEKREVFRLHVSVSEHKTGKCKTIALNDEAVAALRLCLPMRNSPYIFASRKGDRPITRSQAWRIIKDAVAAVGLSGMISCHSLRKTWGYHAWTSQAVSPVVITKIYNHSSYEITKRYLGIEQDELDQAYRAMKLF